MLINLHCIIRTEFSGLLRIQVWGVLARFVSILKNESKDLVRKRSIEQSQTSWFTHPIQHTYGKGPRTLSAFLKAKIRRNHYKVRK